MKRPVYLVLTDGGLATARKAAEVIAGDIHIRNSLAGDVEGVTFASVGPHVRALLTSGQPIVGICAAGILIRAAGPALRDKGEDPPIVALSEDGQFAVPLIGGHSGANRLARDLSAALGGTAAVTTAGDVRFGLALDEPPPGWRLANPGDAKGVMGALLNGAAARLEGDADWLETGGLPVSGDGQVSLVSTIENRQGGPTSLVYHPRCLAVGVGCERGAAPEEVSGLVTDCLARANLSPLAVACLTSIDLKSDEAAVLQAAADLNVPARFFDAPRLERETPRLAHPSDIVFAEVGCHGVAEAAALAAVGETGRLIVEKRKSKRATCAIARATMPIDPDDVGRARGCLSIVGLGPGLADWRAPEADAVLAGADCVVGYSAYVDQIAPLVASKDCHRYPLGAERERAAAALELAGTGKSVALISSGDAGIYAMASLVYECLDSAEISDPAQRTEVRVVPGISALQAAAARAGAPLGHDFCAISLSDLLTPWSIIEKRIRAAGEGDFVIAFYNPASSRRDTQLARAQDILLAHRPATTPVVVARQLGRQGERLEITSLGALNPARIDMMTIVIVGAEGTHRGTAGASDFVYTPRGYHRKEGRDS